MTKTAFSKLNISTSPAGRAIAQPMDSTLVELLYQHVTIERNASAQYFAISLWFAERDLLGFAKFFKEESFDELEHASNFANYLILRGQTVQLQELSAPKQKWDSIDEVIEWMKQMETVQASSNLI